YPNNIFGNQQTSTTVCTLAAKGVVLVEQERKVFNSTIATFTDQDGVAAGDFAATIIWGDGAVTQNANTVALGSSQFAITRSHTYLADRPFAVAVQVVDKDDGCTAVAATFVDVCPLDDDNRLQSVLDGSVTGGGTITQVGPNGQATYNIDAN